MGDEWDNEVSSGFGVSATCVTVSFSNDITRSDSFSYVSVLHRHGCKQESSLCHPGLDDSLYHKLKERYF